MGQEPLVAEQIDAGAEFLREFDSYAPVSVACWLNPTGTDSWYLYVASDEIDDSNIGVAYGEVLRTLGAKRDRWLDPFQVRLLNSSDPIAGNAIQIRDRYPASMAARYQSSSMGGMSIEGAYIYPSLAAMKSAP
jgi:hypothetical protein